HHTGTAPLEIRLPIGTGIAGRVAATGELMNISDAQHHEGFSPECDGLTGYHTRSVLCAPIRSRGGAIIGVAQVLNKLDADAVGRADEPTGREFAPPLGVILE